MFFRNYLAAKLEKIFILRSKSSKKSQNRGVFNNSSLWMLISFSFPAILSSRHFNIRVRQKTSFQICPPRGDKIPKGMDINNLDHSRCITLAVKICFLLYARCNFDKKSFGKRLSHTNFNQEGRRTDQAIGET